VIAKSKAKKIPRAKLLILQQDVSEPSFAEEKGQDEGRVQTPATPIHIMQRVGHQLGISPDKLTKEQLEADPGAAEEFVHDD
jgi:hypothetical protein